MEYINSIREWLLGLLSKLPFSGDDLTKAFFGLFGALVVFYIINHIFSFLGKVKSILLFGSIVCFYLYSSGVLSPNSEIGSVVHKNLELVKNIVGEVSSRVQNQ